MICYINKLKHEIFSLNLNIKLFLKTFSKPFETNINKIRFKLYFLFIVMVYLSLSYIKFKMCSAYKRGPLCMSVYKREPLFAVQLSSPRSEVVGVK